MTTSLIEAQDAYVARCLAAHRKQGKRSAGLMAARTRRAARKMLHAWAVKSGYTELQADSIVQDAYDVYLLERDAR
jgi:hypothetical protein